MAEVATSVFGGNFVDVRYAVASLTDGDGKASVRSLPGSQERAELVVATYLVDLRTRRNATMPACRTSRFRPAPRLSRPSKLWCPASVGGTHFLRAADVQSLAFSIFGAAVSPREPVVW